MGGIQGSEAPRLTEEVVPMMVVSVAMPEYCDRCGSQAYWRYESAESDSSALCFCGHHSHALMPALRDAGYHPAMLVVRGAAREVVESVP